VSSAKKLFGILGALFLALVLIATALPATGLATTYPITVTDDLDREVTIEALPVRIVSLAPSNTEILFELGLGDRVVGVTDYCDYPPEALEKEKVGGPWATSINIEKIVALQPDFILAEEVNGKELIDTLAGLGFTVFGIKSTDLDDLLDDIRTIGQITDKETEADELIAQMTSKIRAVTGRATWLLPEEKPRVLHICWHDPIYTSGQGTFINDLIERAGGVNIFADLEGWPAVDIEAVIARDPEVIIVTAMGGTGSATWDWVNTEARLKDVSARKNGRIYYIESNWLERPGPRIVLGLEAVAKHLHPEIFFEPYDYDTNGDAVINKSEAIEAIKDYSSGLISKAQAIQVVMHYFKY
jgi:iron complex transport system substrate-binding protein